MKVSVVVPVHNQGRYLEQALESAFRQTRPPDEVIVVNDGSSDDTEEVCAYYGSRIQYVKQDNAGPSAARNAGIARVSSDAVAFLDADDMLCPHWLDQAEAAYRRARERGQRVGVVYCDHILFDGAGTYRKGASVKRVDLPHLLHDPLVFPSGSFVTKQCLEEVGPFNQDLTLCEDWDYWMRVALKGYCFVRTGTPGFMRREHPESLSGNEFRTLHARVAFLRVWLESGEVPDAHRAALREELARHYVRLRRAGYYQGQSTQGYLRAAFEIDPALLTDPWLCTFGAVYATPSPPAQISAQDVRRCITELYQELRAYVDEAGEGRRVFARLRAGSHLAIAAHKAMQRRYVSAGKSALAALLVDPALLREFGRHSSRYAVEVLEGTRRSSLRGR